MLKLFCMSLQICFLISLVKHLKMTLYETLNKTLNVFSRGNYTSTTIFATIESSHVCEYGQFTVELQLQLSSPRTKTQHERHRQ